MVCHSHYPFFDPERPRWPASLSRTVITEMLRGQLGFNDGLVMTDDLDMGAILNEVTFEETIKNAVYAGNDMVMICHRVEMAQRAVEALEKITHSDITGALERISMAKAKLCPPAPFSLEAFNKVDSMIWKLRVDTLGENQAGDLSNEDGKRSPVETY